MAGPAGQLEPHRFAAVAVPQQHRRALRAGLVPVAPLHQRHHHRVQVNALSRQPVLVPAALPGLLVGDLAEQALPDQAGQAAAEHLPGYPRAALHVIEAAHAVEGLAQHQEGRPLPQDLHGRADRAVGRVEIPHP